MMDNSMNNEKNKAHSLNATHFGKRLKTAREDLNLSEKEAADRLRLKPKMIALIEAENFEQGPPALFLRGYIRSYARMLHFPEQEINDALAQLELQTPAATTPTAIPRINTPPIYKTENGPRNYLRWMTAGIVLVLIGLVCLWWNSHVPFNSSELGDTKSTAKQSTQPATTTPATTQSQPTNTKTDLNDPSVVNPAASASEPLPQATDTNSNLTPTIPAIGTPNQSQTPIPNSPAITSPTDQSKSDDNAAKNNEVKNTDNNDATDNSHQDNTSDENNDANLY